MALGGYIAPTIDWTQDSQLPDRLEDFKRECLTLFGLELKDADDNAKALRVIQWAGEPGKRQFKAWKVKAQDLKNRQSLGRVREIRKPHKELHASPIRPDENAAEER